MDKQLTILLPNNVPLEMILVAPGYFFMGSEGLAVTNDERPEHLVHITHSFYIGKYPVTQAQWQVVSWIDIMEGNQEDKGPPAFLNNLNSILSAERPDIFATHHFNLPTEAQWEYAAKGGSRYTLAELKGKRATQLYADYAGSDRLKSCGWFDGNNNVETRPVGLKSPNELGLYDMSGNVWEWCRDSCNINSCLARKDRINSNPIDSNDREGRVMRGGAFTDLILKSNAESCLLTRRGFEAETWHSSHIGFRLVLNSNKGKHD